MPILDDMPMAGDWMAKYFEADDLKVHASDSRSNILVSPDGIEVEMEEPQSKQYKVYKIDDLSLYGVETFYTQTEADQYMNEVENSDYSLKGNLVVA